MVRNRKEAAHIVAAENLGEMVLPGSNRDKAAELVDHILDGTPAPDGVTPYIQERARDAVERGVEHAYGDNVPDDIKRRLGG